MTRIISKESLIQINLNQRIARLEEKKNMPKDLKQEMRESLENGIIPFASFGKNFNWQTKLHPIGANGKLAEFISSSGAGAFSNLWYERTRFEVAAGRDQEPILYLPIYAVTSSPDLPRVIKIYKLTGAGVVFEDVTEGGEVKFAIISSSNQSVTIGHKAVGLKYDEELFIYNELFRLANIERNFGIAHNAVLNDIHFSPILAYAYGAGNQTDGGALVSFAKTDKLVEKYARTLEAAIQAAQSATPARKGPYVLLINPIDQMLVDRVLNRVAQQGFEQQVVSLGSSINSVIAYDGWTGSRGKKPVTYAGVPTGKAYLISTAFRDEDFQSYEKTPLRQQEGNPDVSRFILAEQIWDFRLGAYADPASAVEEITWPDSADGTT